MRGQMEEFVFDWLVDPDMAIFTVVIAGVWHFGFVMALFCWPVVSRSGIIKAAQVDGIPTWRIYSSIIIPSMAAIFLALIVLAHLPSRVSIW